MPSIQINLLVQVRTSHTHCVNLISCQLICHIPVHTLNGPEKTNFIHWPEVLWHSPQLFLTIILTSCPPRAWSQVCVSRSYRENTKLGFQLSGRDGRKLRCDCQASVNVFVSKKSWRWEDTRLVEVVKDWESINNHLLSPDSALSLISL